MRVKINLSLTENVKKFVNEARTFLSDINVYKGNYIVDGKSILGLFSINTSEGIEVEIMSNDKDEITRFENMISQFKEV